jgi:hypothetical protein
LRLWENGITTSLEVSGAQEVNISDDGTVIAFMRNRELWAINSDGSQERLLVNESDIAAMPPTDPGVKLGPIYWIPCTHQLLFSTQPLYENGIYYNDDLYLVDADTLLLKNLFPPEKGGRVFFSPNGQQMALVTPTSIALANYDGSSPQIVLTYWKISSYGPTHLYPSPVWSPDSQSLYVAIPPSDPLQDSPNPTTLWSLLVDAGGPIKLTEFVAAWGNTSIAPDLSLIAYYTLISEGENISQTLHVIQPNGVEVASFPVNQILDWSPDATYFTYWSERDLYIGDMTGGSFPAIAVGEHVIRLDWIDNTQFLVYHGVGDQEKLSLGTIGAEPILITQGGIQGYSFVK